MMRNALLVLSVVLGIGCAAASRAGENGAADHFRFFAFDNGTGRGVLPTEAQADLLSKLGYAGIGYTGCNEIPAMLQALDARQLKMFSIYVALKVGPDGATYDPQLQQAIQQLSGRDTLIWLTVQGGQASSSAYDEQAAAAVREIAELAAASNLRVAFYPHVGFYVATVQDALRLAQVVDRPNVGVSLNLCHFLKLDDEQNLEALIQTAMPRLFAVSINGTDRGDTKAMGWDRLIQTLDRGDFPVASFLQSLQKHGYRGPIGLQCYNIQGDPRENLERSMNAWKRYAASLRSAESEPPRELLVDVPSGDRTLHVTLSAPAGLGSSGSRVVRLVNVADDKDVVVAQRVQGEIGEAESVHAGNCLVAAFPPRGGAADPRRFRIDATAPDANSGDAAFAIREHEGVALQLLEGDRPVLNYNFGVITCERVPQNDVRRTRACYVHPVWGLDGEVLTDDFPKDHYHHHGLFWAWPHVLRDGKEYDLWTGTGIQHRFGRWLCRETGPVAAVLAGENGWFVGDEKVMIERVCLRVFKAEQDSQTIDLTFEWIPVEKPITLIGAPGKSYGGITIRYAERTDTAITVPSGLTKEDLLETPLPWADFSARFAGRPEPSGAAVLISPHHPDFPPTWLTRHYGCLCVGWPGVVSQTFAPEQKIRTAYRVLIHRGQPDAAAMEKSYSAYGAAVNLKWKD
jgi:sugar phosphate isomerase/epimerase